MPNYDKHTTKYKSMTPDWLQIYYIQAECDGDFRNFDVQPIFQEDCALFTWVSATTQTLTVLHMNPQSFFLNKIELTTSTENAPSKRRDG